MNNAESVVTVLLIKTARFDWQMRLTKSIVSIETTGCNSTMKNGRIKKGFNVTMAREMY